MKSTRPVRTAPVDKGHWCQFLSPPVQHRLRAQRFQTVIAGQAWSGPLQQYRWGGRRTMVNEIAGNVRQTRNTHASCRKQEPKQTSKPPAEQPNRRRLQEGKSRAPARAASVSTIRPVQPEPPPSPPLPPRRRCRPTPHVSLHAWCKQSMSAW